MAVQVDSADNTVGGCNDGPYLADAQGTKETPATHHYTSIELCIAFLPLPYYQNPVLIDSGPIVAALCASDLHHQWAKLNFEALSEPCVTCEAVLSESFFLLSRAPSGMEKLCAMLDREIITTDFSLSSNLSEITSLMRRYADTPMSFADACLVRLAETQEDSVVFTTDRDFETYRKNGRKVIPLAKPW